MIEFVKKSAAWALAVTTGIFTFVPESFFENSEWISQEFLEQYKLFADLEVKDVNVIISRLACLMGIWIVISLVYALFLKIRRWINIKGENYCSTNGDLTLEVILSETCTEA